MADETSPAQVFTFGRVVRSVRRERPLELLKVIVRPDKVDAVREAINTAGVPGVTITEVRGHGRQKNQATHYRGQEYQLSMLPRMELEVVVTTQMGDEATPAIMAAARTGQVGDGRVYVLPVERSYRIRTGELDPI